MNREDLEKVFETASFVDHDTSQVAYEFLWMARFIMKRVPEGEGRLVALHHLSQARDAALREMQP